MKKLSRTLSDIGEFALIERIGKSLGHPKYATKGIGDDAAVWPADKKHYWLLTTDQIAEGVDFNLKRAKPDQIGWKAIACNVSDIAAMGGWPVMATVTLGLPGAMRLSFFDRLQRGMRNAARKFKLDIVGGDLSRFPRIVISVSMIGKVEKKNLTLRSGAKVGDSVLVSGRFGGSILGKHLSFKPRLNLSRYLVAHYKVNSMIDVSDGLVQDLGHILKASGVGAEIFLKKVPISGAAKHISKNIKARALRHALTDGEDFELLWTMPKSSARKLLQRKLPCAVSEIGIVTKTLKLCLKISEAKSDSSLLNFRGFRHF